MASAFRGICNLSVRWLTNVSLNASNNVSTFGVGRHAAITTTSHPRGRRKFARRGLGRTDMGNHATPLHADSTEVQAAPAGSLAPRYRWTILFCAWMAFMLSYVDRVAWSSVAAPVGQSLGLSVGMLGAFVTAFY